MAGGPSLRQAAILVGGRGTRLGALTQATPKPLLPVAGRPFLDIVIERLAAQGIADIVLLCGYLADQMFARYHGSRQAGASIRCVTEPAAAGTAGALLAARDVLADEFVLTNGDSLFDCDLAALAALPVADDWMARLALRRAADTGRAGIVSLDGSRITGFAERGEPGRPGVMNAGIYMLRRAVLDQVGPLPCSLEKDIFPRLAATGRLYGLVSEGFFIDIGIPEDLERAQTLSPSVLAGGRPCGG